jgi:peptidoglycan/LPS O-acetylase OafA/YrhL
VILHNETGQYPFFRLDRVFANGRMGVDLFFVLSGFLITGILLDTKGSAGYFKNFYARRCLRIWPLYYASLLLMFGIIPVLRPAHGHTIFKRSSPWWAFPLFIQNFLIPAPARATGLLGVTWSLAIEEQFYLVWPLVVGFCSIPVLRWIALSVVCLSPVLRLFLSAMGVDLYANTFSRLDGLMAGALVALVIRARYFVPSRFLRAAWLVLWSRDPARLCHRGVPRTMDRLLDVGGGFGVAGLPVALFRPPMAARRLAESVPRLHGNDQLRAVATAQNSV